MNEESSKYESERAKPKRDLSQKEMAEQKAIRLGGYAYKKVDEKEKTLSELERDVQKLRRKKTVSPTRKSAGRISERLEEMSRPR